MKTFLENLKKELNKRNFSKEDIEEILEDHEEMIEAAQKEGISDEELEKKFGSPQKLAEDLLESKSTDQEEKENVNIDGYQLLKTFPVIERDFDVKISLVSDDIKYLIHDQDQIKVYYKDIEDIKDYIVKFDGKELLLDYKKMPRFNFRKNSGQFIIKVPEGVISKKVDIKVVSSDVVLDEIHSNVFDLKTTSGDVLIKSFKAQSAKCNTVSGNLNLINGVLSSLNLSMVSGDTVVESSKIDGDIVCNTVSGDIKLTKVEAGTFTFKTVSGDCLGVEFYPKRVSLRSVSGDININNEDTAREIKILHKKALSGSIKIN